MTLALLPLGPFFCGTLTSVSNGQRQNVASILTGIIRARQTSRRAVLAWSSAVANALDLASVTCIAGTLDRRWCRGGG